MHLNAGGPTPRAAHTMCSFGQYLVIFGGRDTESRTNDLHIYDTGMLLAQTAVCCTFQIQVSNVYGANFKFQTLLFDM